MIHLTESIDRVIGRYRIAIIIAMSISLGIAVGCSKVDNTDMVSNIEAQCRQLINDAENIAAERPTEALDLIRRVDTRNIVSDATRAHYALVYSEVCYYNRMLVDSDSLTRIATSYYATSEEHDMRARAFYHHGLVMQMADRMPEAVIALNEASNSLENIDNPHLEGLVHRTKGDIYRSGYLHHNSLDAFEAAKECFERAGLPYHTHYASYNMAQAAISMDNFDIAEPLCYEALEYAISANDKNFLCAILHELCEIYLQQNNFTRCSEVIELFDKYDCAIWFMSRYYALHAIVEAEIGDQAKAIEYLEMAEQYSPQDIIIINRAKYHILKRCGNYEAALQRLMASNEQHRIAMRNALNEPILNYEIDLLEQNLKREKREAELIAQRNDVVERHNRVIRQRNIIIYILIAATIIPLLIFVLHRSRRRQRIIANYMEAIKELNSTATHTMSDVHKLFNDIFSDINHMCETYYEHGNTPREAAKIFDGVKNSINGMKSAEAIARLEMLVNIQHNNIVRRLRQECPKLNDRELKVIIYSYAGFSTRSISIFLDCDLAALSRLKYKIKSKLTECNHAEAATIVASLLKH